MITTSRRDLILSAAVAGAALGLDKSLAIAAPVESQQTPAAPARSQHTPAVPAPRQQTPDPNPGYLRYKVGDAECTALYDGIWEKAHDPKYFGNATTAEIKQALANAGLTTAFVPIPITVFIIKLNGKLVLCDVGGGDQVQAFNPKSVFVSGKMMANMKAAGIDPKEIETILISHFHPDHIFGLLEKKTNAPVFPNAEIIVPAAEYKWWTEAGRVEKLPEGRKALGQRIQTVFPTWKNWKLVEDNAEVAPGVRLLAAVGHTPGHSAFLVTSGKDQLMVSNDTMYVPALLAPHPEWQGAYDQDGPTAVATRRKLIDRVIADKMMICGAHFPFPGAGVFAKDGDAYTFTPVVQS